MKYPIVGALVLLIVSISAVAKDEGSDIRQWQASRKSMFDLTHDGYQIITVSSYPGLKPDGINFTFFLQKNTEVFKCVESHTKVKQVAHEINYFSCAHLVRLYEYDATTDKLEQ
jgi:hypothetical protein